MTPSDQSLRCDLLFGKDSIDLNRFSGLQTAPKQIKNPIFLRNVMGCIFPCYLFLLVYLPLFYLSVYVSMCLPGFSKSFLLVTFDEFL